MINIVVINMVVIDSWYRASIKYRYLPARALPEVAAREGTRQLPPLGEDTARRKGSAAGAALKIRAIRKRGFL